MDFEAVKLLLDQPKNIVITTHRSPDGDAIGSSLGLYHILKAHGHSVDVIVPDQFPGFLKWMTGSDSVIVYELSKIRSKEALKKADIIFSLDYNNLSRIADLGALVEESKAIKILIDHHLEPSPDYDFSLSDTSASSTGQLIYTFADSIGLANHINQPIAECLYTGIMTDTGSFKFSSTSALTHRIVANLMDCGLVPDKVHNAIFDTNTFSRLKLLGFTLSERFEYDAERKISVLRLSNEDKLEYSFQKGDSEGFVNYGLSIGGSKMAVFLSEDEEGYTKFSFRSKGELDVNKIARSHFNGGGHKNAAGGKLDMPIEEAYKQLRKVINEMFKV
ncbi:MAG: bifunctional oligoribonuclease/PAP phosphatase NrnA [Salibacteraceae bacterium]|nr:bifunctional oligoribonuclease/PAP phosphatase NrnA [Salibacteraceae bacterium]